MACTTRGGDVELARQVGPDDGVRAVHLVVDGLADVVQEAPPAADVHVRAQLGRHRGGEEGDLQGVGELVLAVAVAELEAPHGADQLLGQPVHAGLVGGLLPLLPQLLVHLRLGPRHHLLDPRGVEAPVRDQLQQGDPRHLPAHGVERGEDDRLRGVVDDQVDPGGLLQGADVAPLLADDAPLHLVVGDGHRRLGRLHRGLRGAALDGLGHDPAGAPAGLFFGLALDLPHPGGRLAQGFRFDRGHQLHPRLVRRSVRRSAPARPGAPAPGAPPRVRIACSSCSCCTRDLSRFSRFSSLRSNCSSRCDRRCSWRCTSARRCRASCSAPVLSLTASSLASRTSSFCRVRASSRMRSASAWATRACSVLERLVR